MRLGGGGVQSPECRTSDWAVDGSWKWAGYLWRSSLLGDDIWKFHQVFWQNAIRCG